MQSNSQNAQEGEWVRRAQEGDEEAFAHLVAQYERRVFSLVFHVVRRQSEVEDLAQEVFIKIFKSIRSYNFQASFGAWVARITVNHCYDYLRRVRSSRLTYYWQLSEEGRRLFETASERSEKAPLSVEQQTVLKDVVEKLLERAPVDDRRVLALKEMENLSIDEIATVLNWTPTKVKVRLHRARKRMLADFKRWQQGGKP